MKAPAVPAQPPTVGLNRTVYLQSRGKKKEEYCPSSSSEQLVQHNTSVLWTGVQTLGLNVQYLHEYCLDSPDCKSQFHREPTANNNLEEVVRLFIEDQVGMIRGNRWQCDQKTAQCGQGGFLALVQVCSRHWSMRTLNNELMTGLLVL